MCCGSAHAGDHILALGVEQELAVELLGAGGGIAGESNAGAGGVSHVAEDHGLHVDGGAEHVVDVVHAAIVLGAIVLPGAENRVARHHELIVSVLREVDLGVLLDDLLVLGDDFLQGCGVEVGIQLRLLLLLLAVEDLFKVRLFNVEHHVAEHLDEAAVGVIGKARVLGALGQSLDALIVQAEVQNRIHHAGHGELCAGANGDQQGIVAGAELLALQSFELRRGRHPFPCQHSSLTLPRMYSRQASVWMVNPGGTGRPALVISARPAPLPPRMSFILPLPSALPPPKE